MDRSTEEAMCSLQAQVHVQGLALRALAATHPDPAALLAEVDGAIDEYEDLVRRINRTNSATTIGPAETLTDALARRDALRLRHHVLKSAADAAAGTDRAGYTRQLRSELKMLSALPVAQLRADADRVAQEHRELDVRIQQRNWEVDLID